MTEGVKLHAKGRHYCGRNAEVEGNIFKFKGEGGSVGVVKMLEPMSPMLNYFEYEILDRGQKCAIGVGVGEQGYPLDRMPGWNRNGIGYHADDGRLFHQDGWGKAFGQTCTVGDRMGCGVDFAADCGYGYVNVFFTKNGVQVGEPTRMKRPIYGLYPLIGLHSKGEKVRYLGHWKRTPDGNQEPMEQDNSPSTFWLRSNGVKFVEDGLTLEYAGDGLDRQDGAVAQANFCMDRTNHYFEMEILNSGREGWLAIGVAKTTYPLHRHPGWNKGSVGYHADNGHLYKEVGHGVPFGPCCTEGDVMGCGIRFTPDTEHSQSNGAEADTDTEDEDDLELADIYGYEESEDDDTSDDILYSDEEEDDYLFREERLFRRAHLRALRAARPAVKREHSSKDEGEEKTCVVYFTKNGDKVGETECTVPKGGFYPIVALLSQGEKLRVNFSPLSG